jgi:hypothetical protein
MFFFIPDTRYRVLVNLIEEIQNENKGWKTVQIMPLVVVRRIAVLIK